MNAIVSTSQAQTLTMLGFESNFKQTIRNWTMASFISVCGWFHRIKLANKQQIAAVSNIQQHPNLADGFSMSLFVLSLFESRFQFECMAVASEPIINVNIMISMSLPFLPWLCFEVMKTCDIHSNWQFIKVHKDFELQCCGCYKRCKSNVSENDCGLSIPWGINVMLFLLAIACCGLDRFNQKGFHDT